MSGPYRTHEGSFEQLSAVSDAQAFCTRALALLEVEFRGLALLALADWERLELSDPQLFAAIGALQRPSWGAWNFLLQSLRNARKAQLRGGRTDARERVARARTLAAILAALDANASREAIEAATPLNRFLGDKSRLRRLTDVLVLPIALRNQVAHFPPTEDQAWIEMRAALAPLIAWHATGPLAELTGAGEASEPWFVLEDGQWWSYNGADNDLVPQYGTAASSRPKARPDLTRAFRQALQRLLGKTEQQETSFHRLLARLAPEDIKGVVMGDFLVGRPIARGGFATVHVGRQLSTGRKVALKIMHDGFDDDIRARFQQEAAYLSRLSHPAVVGVITYGEDTWTLPRFVSLQDEPWFADFARGAAVRTYIALEWIEGQTVEDLYQEVHVAKTREPPSLAEIGAWFRDAASALESVHAAGLIHRDVKPSNLMITDDGLRLMDFGIARTDDENRTLHTTIGTRFGTPAYMSPEQIRSLDADAEVGPATDIYSLAATFYELITGRRLYAHDRESADSVRTQKLSGERPLAGASSSHTSRGSSRRSSSAASNRRSRTAIAPRARSTPISSTGCATSRSSTGARRCGAARA